MGVGLLVFLGLDWIGAMRAEVKVYMSHTDYARVQEAARRTGETISGFVRRVALMGADSLAVPRYKSVLEGQQEMRLEEITEGVK